MSKRQLTRQDFTKVQQNLDSYKFLFYGDIQIYTRKNRFIDSSGERVFGDSLKPMDFSERNPEYKLEGNTSQKVMLSIVDQFTPPIITVQSEVKVKGTRGNRLTVGNRITTVNVWQSNKYQTEFWVKTRVRFPF